jgi:hypothetical protein
LGEHHENSASTVFFSKLLENVSEMLQLRSGCWILAMMRGPMLTNIGRFLNQSFERPEKLGN